MCGIAGVFSLDGQSVAAAEPIVAAINGSQRRRGPDGEGIWRAPGGDAVFGHRRLAIIDTRAEGAQPMRDATGRWTIVFNGEIYNYRALCRELENAGRRFETKSDTEVLINCIAEWGEAGLSRLIGMYAFALYDGLKRELWLARDPFGVKPLYYAIENGRLWFASQARALARAAPVDAKTDNAAAAGFFLHGYVPEPLTWWRGVRALSPGCSWRLRCGEAPAQAQAFFSLSALFAQAAPQPMQAQDLRAVLTESVQRHFVSDVPVGIFLSSGVDSIAIAALARDAACNFSTITLAFDDYRGERADEAPLAEAAADALGVRHDTVRLSQDDFLASIDDYFDQMDQPSTDGLNVFLVSRAAARAGLKVALSGLGGDELFGGYPSFADAPRIAALGRAMPLRAPLGAMAGRFGAPLARLFGLNHKTPYLLRYAGDIERAYFLRRCLRVFEELDATQWADGLARLKQEQTPEPPPSDISPHAQVAFLEMTRYMRNQPLRDADWASMAHSLELRVPFLDVALLRALAPAIISSAPPRKADLAAAAGPLAVAAWQRGKTGFATPVDRWIGGAEPGLMPWADRVAARFGVARTRAG
ncbi:MAG: asparagine synthase (glutamine-hydrolyzing) [Hyphomicrobiales bacterium]|nr:asparagine synthase (glutamine-hydrolyzing) [Hyphomicrobiales bacterium]